MIAAVFLQNYYIPVSNYDSQAKVSVTTTQDGKILVGQTILITGGIIGIGYEIAKAQVEYGTSVIIASRNKAKLIEAYESLRLLCKNGNTSDFFELDLSDLNAVMRFTNEFMTNYSHTKLSQLIENAGLWTRDHNISPLGFEITFATNTLGHYLLRSRLSSMNILELDCRIVVVTGDIYIMAKEGTSTFTHKGDGQMAYCRSKLDIL